MPIPDKTAAAGNRNGFIFMASPQVAFTALQNPYKEAKG